MYISTYIWTDQPGGDAELGELVGLGLVLGLLANLLR